MKLAARHFGLGDTPNALCPICGAPVFFYHSPAGGRVFFDELGHPWPKHPCTDNPALTVALRTATEELAEVPDRHIPARHAGGREWRPIQISAPRREGLERVIACRDLVTSRRFKVYVDQGFAVGDATVASMTPWSPGGWTILSICRLDLNPTPLILAGRSSMRVDSILRDEEMKARLDEEVERVQRPIREARHRREKAEREAAKAEARLRRQEELAQALRELQQVLVEAEEIGAGPFDVASRRRLRSLEERWRRNVKCFGKDVPPHLRAEFAQVVRDLDEKFSEAELVRETTSRSVLRQRLGEEAEALAESGPWEQLAPRFKELMDRWKSTGDVDDDVARAHWQKIQDSFLVARDTEHRPAVKARLRAIEELNRSALQERDDATDVERVRAAVRTWWAAGSVGGAVRPALESRYRSAHFAALRELPSHVLRNYSTLLRAEARAAALRGARIEDLSLAGEQEAVELILRSHDAHEG